MMSFSIWQKLAAAMIENAVRCGLKLVLALVTVAMMKSSLAPAEDGKHVFISSRFYSYCFWPAFVFWTIFFVSGPNGKNQIAAAFGTDA